MDLGNVVGKTLMRALAVVLSVLAVAPSAFAQPKIVVTLSKSSNAAEAEAAVVDVEVKNTGNAPTYIFDPYLPMIDDKVLMNGRFNVIGADGKNATYRGISGKIILTKEGFRRFAPGDVRHFEVDLGVNYLASPGMAKVSYLFVPYYDRPFDNSDGEDVKPAGKASSNTIDVWFNPSLIEKRRSLLKSPGGN